MHSNYELSEEEIARRRKRRREKRRRRKIRRIKGIIMLSATLILLIAIIVGIISGIVKVIKHFTHKEPAVVEVIDDSPMDSGDLGFPIPNDNMSNPAYTGTNSLPLNFADTHGNLVPYATKSPNYIEVTDEGLRAPYAVLMNATDATVLAGRECDTIIYPASMTKVMTLIVAVDHLSQIPSTYTFVHDDIAPHIYAGASRAGFEEGETVPVVDLLYGLILPSGADAATAIANAVAGSEAAFAQMMNDKCREIGLTKTHFANPSGLYDETQVTTCTEMAMIMAYAMQNELCAQVLSTYQYTTTATPENPEGLPLTSTMFSRMYGTEVENVTITSGKTGYTTEAGNCMVSYAVKNGQGYVCVTASSTNKWHCIYDSFELFGKYLP